MQTIYIDQKSRSLVAQEQRKESTAKVQQEMLVSEIIGIMIGAVVFTV